MLEPNSLTSIYISHQSSLSPATFPAPTRISVNLHQPQRAMAEIGEVGSLGQLLENDVAIRDIARREKQLTQWPCPKTDGVPSCPALGCNLRLLILVLDWWAINQTSPKPVPVEVLRNEVRGLHLVMLFKPQVIIQLSTWVGLCS